MNDLPVDDGPQCVDVSHDKRDWLSLIPDQWFYVDQLRGKELALQIKTAESEQYPDAQPRPYLTFHNDERKLGLSREHRLILRHLFGTPDNSIDKWITVTAGPNLMKTVVVKILPRETVAPVQIVEAKPPKRRGSRRQQKDFISPG